MAADPQIPTQLPIWVPLLAGIAGALLTLCVQGLVWLWRRPQLALSWNAHGCEITTPTAGGQQRVLRLFIKNDGRTAAHNVNVSVIELSHWDLGAAAETAIAVDEVLDLHLGMSDRTVFDLAPGAHHWVDLAFVDDIGRGPSFRFGFIKEPMRLALQGFGSQGNYSASVIATAENAKAKTLRVNWEWDGTLEGLIFRR